MIFAANAAGRFKYLCPEWLIYTGQSKVEACGDGWFDKIHPSDRDIVRKVLTEAVLNEVEFSLRFRVECADRSMRWIGAGGVPSFGPPGRTFLGYLGSMTEMVMSSTDAIVAYGSIGAFVPPPEHLSTKPVTSLDMVADHLLIVHALVLAGNDQRSLPSVREALFLVGCGLAQQGEAGTRIN